MMGARLVIAVVIQVMVFGIFAYMDAWAIVNPNWLEVRRLALHPFVMLFFGLSGVIVWPTYRIIYQHFNEDFWVASLFVGLIVTVARIAMLYLGSRRMPTTNQIVALGLSLVAVIVSGIKIGGMGE